MALQLTGTPYVKGSGAGTSGDPFVPEHINPSHVVAGDVTGERYVHRMGEREAMGTGAAGEDIWRGTAVSIPKPADAGVQMAIISGDAADAAAGTGAREVTIEYLDASGNEQTTTVVPNGSSAVNLTPTNIRFINDCYVTDVGSNGVAVGQLDIHLSGAVSTVYDMIAAGGNKSLVPHFMVPTGYELLLEGWHAEEAQNKRVNVRIRADCTPRGVANIGMFLFKDTCYMTKASTGPLSLHYKIPALCTLKVSGWGDTGSSGAEVGCGWFGKLRAL